MSGLPRGITWTERERARMEARLRAVESGGAGAVAWDDVTDKPDTFPPAAHTQAASSITGLAAVATSGAFADLSGVPAQGRGVATLDFGNYGEDAVVEVTGQTAIPTGASVIATVAAVDTPENLADEVVLDPPMIVAGAVVAGVGFNIYGRALEGGLHGRINVNWHWR